MSLEDLIQHKFFHILPFVILPKTGNIMFDSVLVFMDLFSTIFYNGKEGI